MPFFSLPTGGSPVLAGVTAPTGGVGNVGDLFIDTVGKLLYGPKEGGGWPSGPIDLSQGPAGGVGATGATGSTGGAGSTGPTAPASTLAVGSVSTGATAAASITGTAPSQTIHFTFPVFVGATGAASFVAGPTGPPGGPTGATGPSGGPVGATGSTGPAGGFNAAQDINARTADYTLVLADAGKLVTMATGSTGTQFVILPAASGVAFATGTHVDVARLGTGPVTITGATGVTVNATPGQRLRARFSAATCILYAGDTWLVVGDLS